MTIIPHLEMQINVIDELSNRLVSLKSVYGKTPVDFRIDQTRF